MLVKQLSWSIYLPSQICGTRQCVDKKVYSFSQSKHIHNCPHQFPTSDSTKETKSFSLIPGPKPLPVVGNIWRYAIGETRRMYEIMNTWLLAYRIFDSISRTYGFNNKWDIINISLYEVNNKLTTYLVINLTYLLLFSSVNIYFIKIKSKCNELNKV